MTCKDCLHYEACRDVYDTLAYKNKTYDFEFNEEDYARIGCFNFADRSEWIHLPCDVGDIVYLLFGGKCGEYRITQMSIDAAGDLRIRADCNMHGYRKMRDCAKEYCGRAICTAGLGASAFGDIAFLTREEAEKALEEKKSD